MMQDWAIDAALVVAAREGTPAALEELVGQSLPLVYNIVGRALPVHADVDDVVQETMLRVVKGLCGLRDPQAYRSWLVAVTMNQIRKHHRSRPAPTPALEEMTAVADPGADFVDYTLTQLGLTGQRRETAEATRWLDDDDRELLSLWWQVVTDHLTHMEMAEALGLAAPLASVRVNRMKTQLETGRLIVRALAIVPRCADLSHVLRTFDGRPTGLWRKRIARHLRDCGYCGLLDEDLIAPERLLVGLALVPLPLGYAAYALAHTPHATVAAINAAHASRRAHSHAYRAIRGRRRRPGHSLTSLTSKPALTVAAFTTSVSAALGITALASWDGAESHKLATASDNSAATRPSPSPTPQPTPTPSPTPPPTPTRPTPTSAKPSPHDSTPAEQVLAQINKARTAQGLHPYRMDAKMTAVATKHNHLMIDGCGFNHYCDGEPDPCDRDAGPDGPGNWCGENIATLGGVGDSSNTSLAHHAKDLTQSLLDEGPNGGHHYNLLSPVHVTIGISIVWDKGTIWMTQEFGD